MGHDDLCELKMPKWGQLGGCLCAQRALEADPLPEELVAIYPDARSPGPEVPTSTSWLAAAYRQLNHRQ